MSNEKPVVTGKLSLEALQNIMREQSTGIIGGEQRTSKTRFMGDNFKQLPNETVIGTGTIKKVLVAGGYPANHNPELLQIAKKLVDQKVLRFVGKDSRGHNTWMIVAGTPVTAATPDTPSGQDASETSDAAAQE
jgi:hypothetical protein